MVSLRQPTALLSETPERSLLWDLGDVERAAGAVGAFDREASSRCRASGANDGGALTAARRARCSALRHKFRRSGRRERGQGRVACIAVERYRFNQPVSVLCSSDPDRRSRGGGCNVPRDRLSRRHQAATLSARRGVIQCDDAEAARHGATEQLFRAILEARNGSPGSAISS